MGQTSISLLAGWANFYVIIGSSAGALTGLQFVVIALMTQTQVAGDARGIRAFGSPTVVHFCVALLISGIMTAPWHALSHVSFCIGVCGAAGLIYSLTVLNHAKKASYNPDAEDWFWYTVLPLLAYIGLLLAAVLLWWHAIAALFVTAGTTLVFLFTGIHNAWDTVTYVVVRHARGFKKEESPREQI